MTVKEYEEMRKKNSQSQRPLTEEEKKRSKEITSGVSVSFQRNKQEKNSIEKIENNQANENKDWVNLFMKKKYWVMTSIGLLILILLNPTLQDFKEYKTRCYKIHNYLIFSIYASEECDSEIPTYYTTEDGVREHETWMASHCPTKKYLGIAKNFYELN